MVSISYSHRPNGDWVFDDEVAKCFDHMLKTSVPMYDEMIRSIFSIISQNNFSCKPDNGSMLDLGCGTATTLKELACLSTGHSVVGIDSSESMVKIARENTEHLSNASIYCQSVTDPFPDKRLYGTVLSVLTLMFIPPLDRLKVLKMCHDRLDDNGIMFVVEKCETNFDEDIIVPIYHLWKMSQGYSKKSIENKSSSLKGVLVPFSAWENEVMFKQAKFKSEIFFAHHMFRGWILKKG
tara:strand:- start:694 stop:1407 length:714 start_codon:yes stop_codon:yes gene_type:complete